MLPYLRLCYCCSITCLFCHHFSCLSPSDQLSPEAQQAAAAEHRRWLQHQPLLARLFTSQQQEDSIRSLTQQQPAAATAAISDAPNGAEVDMLQLDAGSAGGGAATAAAADVGMLKQDMLRMEMLVADALQVCVAASVLSAVLVLRSQ
jgi:hypothetical protein